MKPIVEEKVKSHLVALSLEITYCLFLFFWSFEPINLDIRPLPTEKKRGSHSRQF
jgi:hypothetical protein